MTLVKHQEDRREPDEKAGLNERNGNGNGQGKSIVKAKKKPWWQYVIHPHRARTIAKYCPLIAAIAAPVSTLLDIPALSVCYMLHVFFFLFYLSFVSFFPMAFGQS